MRSPPTFAITRKLIVVLLMFLAGGAVVNVAVAWGGQFLFVHSDVWLKVDDMAVTELWRACANSDWSETPGYAMRANRLTWTIEQAHDSRSNLKRIERHRCGLPVRSLQGWWAGADWTNPIGIKSFVVDRRFRVYLPYRPIWPGFAINTIFYAAILALLFFVPRKLRRTLRIRRGLCAKCAYPIGSSPVCTECGAEVSRSQSITVA